MREKYIVECDDIHIGIWYDAKKKRMFVGCQRKFSEEIGEIIESYFDLSKSFVVKIPKGSRTRWELKVARDSWVFGIRNLKKSFTVETVRSLGRLVY